MVHFCTNHISFLLYINEDWHLVRVTWPVALKETSTLKAKGHLIIGNTVLFQISVESPVMRYQCQAKQGLPITYFYF